jgi:hypothetical protein
MHFPISNCDIHMYLREPVNYFSELFVFSNWRTSITTELPLLLLQTKTLIFEIRLLFKIRAVGFEPTRISPPELESGALDHSAKLADKKNEKSSWELQNDQNRYTIKL